MIMKALPLSETSVLTRETWRNIPEAYILQVEVDYSSSVFGHFNSSLIHVRKQFVMV
jgi:hypothetical protein